jgi:hypothetical protein
MFGQPEVILQHDLTDFARVIEHQLVKLAIVVMRPEFHYLPRAKLTQ